MFIDKKVHLTLVMPKVKLTSIPHNQLHKLPSDIVGDSHKVSRKLKIYKHELWAGKYVG